MTTDESPVNVDEDFEDWWKGEARKNEGIWDRAEAHGTIESLSLADRLMKIAARAGWNAAKELMAAPRQ